MKKNDFFDKPFCEKRFVAVSICESNIKSKKGTYYGKVCKTGHLNTKQLLQIVKDRFPHINIPLAEDALQTIADVILDMVGQGYSVDFANLGTFSLSTQGKIEMNKADTLQNSTQLSPQHLLDSIDNVIEASSDDYIEDLIDELEEEKVMAGNYDVSQMVKKEVNFTFKFSPSKTLKSSMKNIKMSLAVKKKHSPIIKKVRNALPNNTNNFSNTPSVIRISGSGLKIMGDNENIGIYIEEKIKEKSAPYIMKNHINKIIKVPVSSIIQNENKTLTCLLNQRLKKGATYSITIITQGISGGKLGKKLRYAKTEFIWKTGAIYENSKAAHRTPFSQFTQVKG